MERQPKETANDRNDRAIRMAAKWYKKNLEINQDDVEANERVQVVLLTNDKDNAQKAREDGINTFTSKGTSLGSGRNESLNVWLSVSPLILDQWKEKLIHYPCICSILHVLGNI